MGQKFRPDATSTACLHFRRSLSITEVGWSRRPYLNVGWGLGAISVGRGASCPSLQQGFTWRLRLNTEATGLLTAWPWKSHTVTFTIGQSKLKGQPIFKGRGNRLSGGRDSIAILQKKTREIQWGSLWPFSKTIYHSLILKMWHVYPKDEFLYLCPSIDPQLM